METSSFLTASGQNRQLRCVECDNCESANATSHSLRLCYGQGPDPTRPSEPITSNWNKTFNFAKI